MLRKFPLKRWDAEGSYGLQTNENNLTWACAERLSSDRLKLVREEVIKTQLFQRRGKSFVETTRKRDGWKTLFQLNVFKIFQFNQSKNSDRNYNLFSWKLSLFQQKTSLLLKIRVMLIIYHSTYFVKLLSMLLNLSLNNKSKSLGSKL